MVSTVAQERRISPHILSNLPSRLWAPVNVPSEIDRSISFIACSHNTAPHLSTEQAGPERIDGGSLESPCAREHRLSSAPIRVGVSSAINRVYRSASAANCWPSGWT